MSHSHTFILFASTSFISASGPVGLKGRCKFGTILFKAWKKGSGEIKKRKKINRETQKERQAVPARGFYVHAS